jgi:hypothetical protein
MDNMRPSWTVYGQLEGDIRDEEVLNNCFADVIDDTLACGPTLLNHLLNGLIEFDENTQIEGTDLEPLPYRDEGKNRKIDITVGDDSTIVGLESKRRDSLSAGQLQDELEKLEYNATDRDVLLIAVTEHLQRPALIDELPEEVRWTSWFRLAQQVYDTDSLDSKWDPTISRMKKLFREFGYEGFDGIDTDEFRVSVWELWKQVATETDSIETGQRWPYKNINRTKNTSQGWKPIDRDWMLLTFSGDNSGDHREPCYAILSNKRTQEIRVGVSIRPWKDKNLRDFMCENAESLADRVLEEGLEVIQFPLNWLVGRKNLPRGHKKAMTARYPSSHDELSDAFSDRQSMKTDGANRFLLAYSVDITNAVEESVECLTQLQYQFGTDDGPELRAFID